jgi:ATP-dependent Clp protease ATP-binding subunit ClpA
MFERFTESARGVVVAAQDEARGLGHGFIGCEHLLIAVAGSDGAARSALQAAGVTQDGLRAAVIEVAGRGPGPDPEALATLGIDLDEVRRRVEAAFGPGALERPRGRRCGDSMPFTKHSKRALERSLRAATSRGDRSIRSEHILLGILDTPPGVGAEALARLGVTPERIRQELSA